MKCLDCQRTFRVPKGKNWVEQLCGICYKKKHNLVHSRNHGAGRKFERKTTWQGFIRGEGKKENGHCLGGHINSRKGIITKITPKNIDLYLKLREIITGDKPKKTICSCGRTNLEITLKRFDKLNIY